MKTKWMGAALLAALIGATGCSKNEDGGDGGDGGGGSNASKLESYAMTPEWINYATAVSSELLDDCVGLWAAWNGPTGIPDEDWERIGRDFFSKNTVVGANGYAEYMRTADAGNAKFTSGVDAIRTILVDGFANISNEVGSSKIGNPNTLAKDGKTAEAVLQVESWYSWNSITDYSDNIISIKNGYAGRIGAIGDAAHANSISAYVKSRNADLDARMTAAIDGAYNAIKSMQSPFRNNLTGTKVDAAIEACADLTELTEGELLGAFRDAGDYDFTSILTQYADQVVTPTYKDMKEKAWTLYKATIRARPKSMPPVPPGVRCACPGNRAKPCCSVPPAKRRDSDSTRRWTVGRWIRRISLRS